MANVSLFALRVDFAPDIFTLPLPIAPNRLAALSRITQPGAQNRSLGGELLLCWAVRTLRPQGVPLTPSRSFLPHGKPYFAEKPDFHFSLSHAGCWAVLAVSDVPVGVDIERQGPSRAHIVRRYFHPEEQDFFFSLPEREQTTAFYQLWVLKESAVKALGTGMHLPFRSFCISLTGAPHVHSLPSPARLSLPSFTDPAHQLGVCTLGTSNITTTCRILTLNEVLTR